MNMDEVMKEIAQGRLEGPEPGSVWQHYKGGIYSIVALALREETCEPVVIYHSNFKNFNWERTLENFQGTVEVDGQTVPRFTRLDT